MIRWIKVFYNNYPGIVILFTLIQYTKAVGFLPQIPNVISYLVIGIYAIFNLYHTKKVDNVFYILVCYIPFNLCIAWPHELFDSWERYVAFLLLLMCVSPFLQSMRNCIYRKNIFFITLWISTVLSSISFFCYFFGINFMSLSDDFDLTHAGVFGGLFNQSMMLGPLAGLSSLFMAFKCYETRSKLCFILMFFCIGALLFSASRSALLATLFSILLMIYYKSGNKGKFIKQIFFLILLAVFTFPLWESATTLVLDKQKANKEAGSTFTSRSSKWNNRFAEFSYNPVCGVGFAAMDVQYREDYNVLTGVMEPGSSWLCILSMTGILGMSVILMIFYKAFKGAKRVRDGDGALLLGCLGFLAVHLIVEGYVFAAGSYLCLIMWLIIGVCIDSMYLKSQYNNSCNI